MTGDVDVIGTPADPVIVLCAMLLVSAGSAFIVIVNVAVAVCGDPLESVTVTVNTVELRVPVGVPVI